jgi:hypothetical protein
MPPRRDVMSWAVAMEYRAQMSVSAERTHDYKSADASDYGITTTIFISGVPRSHTFHTVGHVVDRRVVGRGVLVVDSAHQFVHLPMQNP